MTYQDSRSNHFLKGYWKCENWNKTSQLLYWSVLPCDRIFPLSVDAAVISRIGVSENTHVLSYADLPYIDTFYYKNFKKVTFINISTNLTRKFKKISVIYLRKYPVCHSFKLKKVHHVFWVFFTNLVTQTSALNYHTLNRSIKRYIFKVEI